MTHEEREREAQRLMALLAGEGEALLITEDGDVGAALGDEEEACCCAHCGVFVDESEFGVPGEAVDGEVYCRPCAQIAVKMHRSQCVCRFCWEKCLIFAPVREGEKPTWQSCPLCQGKGWITCLQAERMYPGSQWPANPPATMSTES